MRVEVYWNLHKLCWSVRALEGPNKGRVIKHTQALGLRDCRFAVQPAGRERVLREQRKNVHAFVRGFMDTRTSLPPFDESVCVTYNPYKYDTFMHYLPEQTPREVHPLSEARLVALNPRGIVRAWL